MPSGSKSLPCQIILLDDQVQEFQLPRKAYGDDLYSSVYKHLQLLETDYFGLEFKIDQKDVWLDKDKPILYQIKRDTDLSFKFKVKFYSSDANLLEDEFTRYLFALQVKQDLATGRLICNPNTTALLAAYIAQSELGDYSPEEMPDHTYLKCISFTPDQTDELEQCVMQYHRSLGGMSPSEADFKLLDTARKTDYYGILLKSAQDHEGVSLQLAVTELGICVYQHRQKINTFSWAKIRKLSFKRRRFLIKLHPASDQSYYKNIVEFFFDSRDESKSFWKNCIEHHAFFRCRAIDAVKKQKRAVLTRGSSFRYTGRTQKQLLDHVKDTYVKGTRSFERSLSARHTLNVTASRSFNPSRSTTLNSKSDFNPEASLSSGSHVIGGSQSQHSGFQTPNSFLTPTQSPPREPHVSIHNSPGGMERKYSVPAMSQVEAGVSAPEAYLARAPDYTNIPEKVEEPEIRLSRTDSTSNIPQEVTKDEHAEPTRLQNNHLQLEDSSMIRVHSEAETNILNRYPRVSNPEVPVLQNTDLSNGSPIKTDTTFHLGGTANVVTNGSTTPEHTIDKSRSIKRATVDRSYFIAKELLTTERTYNKDLSILMIHFREGLKEYHTEPAIFNALQPLYNSESEFLSSLEKRLAGDSNKVSADLLANDIAETLDDHLQHLNLYEDYLLNLDKMLFELTQLCEHDEKFYSLLNSFEQEKSCYLPVFSLILKPAHRLVYYEILLSKLVTYYRSITLTVDYSLLQTCLERISHIFSTLRSTIAELENTEKLIELQQDISGLNQLVKNGRYFVREGCLQKLSRRGYQQRLFLLFSDVLLYTSRVTGNSHLQFKIHGFLPLAGMTLEEGDPNIGVNNGFTIYGANRCLIVAASTPEEKDKWLEDLNFAISISNSDQIELQEIPLPEITPPTNGVAGEDESELPTTPDKNSAQPTQHRANTTMHVCWHRNTSVGIKDIQEAIRQQLSGYLLRKFKNSNGWQKLWVVFTNFCLFFYKTYQDDYPLASLPLLGYAVCKPSASDGINKDYVFKLQFKNHVYFFRADSDYTYERWMEVINSATHSARRTRLFSRIDSMT